MRKRRLFTVSMIALSLMLIQILQIFTMNTVEAKPLSQSFFTGTVNKTPDDAPFTTFAGKNRTQATYHIEKKREATYVKEALPGKAKRAEIPAEIKIDNYSYRVIRISPYAFDENDVVEQVEIGRNIKIIKKKAFAGAPNLHKLIIKTTKLNKSSVNGILLNSEINTIIVPKSKLSAYKKIFTKKNTGSLYPLKIEVTKVEI